ncbi:MFS transporter [Acinetobacter baumannii]|uniref:MFS transporter n=1 Tax=Acinetobacter calcoaceticus/baumannii complex TaxID=909768 RepID=UPI00083DCF28|nr:MULTISPECIES: MFS transporter [Acinetobacter calcoaceticus/baumannii complex]MBN6492070.1 MFS transporter [Acinetobacter pittii]MCK0913896.1 MFS transporter [Acinetobacter pittii]MCR0005895.1 MFS transporter [Acinetobacter baumannii]HAV3581661.1 MFS transporter [Acinetobacter baumannii]
MTTNHMSIDDVPVNGFHQLLSIRTGGGWLLDGYVLSIIGVALMQAAAQLQLSNFWQGMIAASALFGMFLGGFLGGWLSDWIGRKKLYFIAPTLFVLCSVAQLWADSEWVLFLCRFMIGIAVGFEYAAGGSLLTEFLPTKARGPRLAMLTIMWFFGAMLAYLFGNMILKMDLNEAWRWVFASPAVIGLILILIRIGTPESPRWLISKGRNAEAEVIIKQVYGPSFSLANVPVQEEVKNLSLTQILASGYGKRVFFCSMFWMCAVIPVFAVYSFAPRVLDAMNLKGSWAEYGSVAITLMFVVGCVIATKLINVMGRRKLIIHSFLWSGLALLGLGAFADGSQMLVLVLFCAYAVLIGGAQVLELVYPNELFPTEMRAIGVGMATSFSRIGAAVGTWLVPMSLDTIGIGNTMFVAAGVTLLGLIVSIMTAPETKGLSLEQATSLKN